MRSELGIADVIGEGRKTTDELAAATKTHAPSLYRALRGLAGAGIFREDGHGVWTNTPLSKVLRSNVPGSLRYAAIASMGQEHYAAWGALTECVRTGGTGIKHVYGKEIWDYYREHERHAKNFDQFMVDFSAGVNAALLKGYDFGGIERLVDVGGGHGGVLAAVLQQYPALRGTLFDQPYDVTRGNPSSPSARRHLNAAGARGQSDFPGTRGGRLHRFGRVGSSPYNPAP